MFIRLTKDSHEVALDVGRHDRVGLVAGMLLNKFSNEGSWTREVSFGSSKQELVVILDGFDLYFRPVFLHHELIAKLN